jgi:hypothetical protein
LSDSPTIYGDGRTETSGARRDLGIPFTELAELVFGKWLS